MPASPTKATTWSLAQAVSAAWQSASRPTRRGGLSTPAGSRADARAREITRLFGTLQMLRAQLAQAVQAAIALVGEPVVKLDADLQRLCTQQLVGSFSIVAQAVGQRQRAAALDQVESGLFAQLKEALAQRVARRVVVMLGPQQPSQPQAGSRALDRQPGQQDGVARGQAMRLSLCGFKLGFSGQTNTGVLMPVLQAASVLRAQERGPVLRRIPSKAIRPRPMTVNATVGSSGTTLT